MKRHALNCYSVLLKILLKTKTYKHVEGNRGSFTVKTTNSEKSIYFLSLMSCSTSKLKSRMSFTCQSFIFSNFTREKVFCSRKWWGWRGEGWRPPAPLPFLYSPGSAWGTLFSYYSVAIYAYSEPYLGRFRYIWNFGLFRNVMFHASAAIFRTFEYVIRHCFMQNKKFSNLEPKSSCLCNFGL